MAGDDEVPVGGRTMQVDAVGDALDVLDNEASRIAPPALPPPLPPKRRKFPLIAALVVGGVAVGAALLVSQWLQPDPPPPTAATAPPTEATAASHGSRIDLGPISIHASHDASAGDFEDDEAMIDEPAAESP